MNTLPNIVIVGPGRVGRVIGHRAFEAGYRIAAVAGGRHPERTQQFADEVHTEILPHAQAATQGDLILLTTRDDAIGVVCQQLAASGGLDHKPLVAHCSGALNVDALQAAAEIGCPVATLHPLQTFPGTAAGRERLAGTYWFLEADGESLAILSALVEAMEGHPVSLAPKDRAIYHAAAVFSANYIITIIDLAIELMAVTGLDREHAREALAPILRASLENTIANGTAASLTGPISRCDLQTIQSHLDALSAQAPQAETLYRAIGERTVDLAKKADLVDESQAKTLHTLLAKGESSCPD